MAFKIEDAKQITVGTTAVSENVNYRDFMIVNNSTTATVYLKEKETDNTAATATNGFALLPGATVQYPMTAAELSLIASAAGTTVTILYGRDIK